MALRKHNKLPITDLAFTSDKLYFYIEHNHDFHRRLTNIFTQLLHNDKFKTTVTNHFGKSPDRHPSDVSFYIKTLEHRLRTAALQRKATTILSSSVKSAPTYSTAVKQNLDNSFLSATNFQPRSSIKDIIPVSRQKSASLQPSSSNPRLAKTNNCTNFKKRFQTNSTSKISSKQNASPTFSANVKASPSIHISTSKTPSRPPSLPAKVLPSAQPLLQQVNVMGLTRAIPLHKALFQPPSPFPTTFNDATFLPLDKFSSRQDYINYALPFLAFTPFGHKATVFETLRRQLNDFDCLVHITIPMATTPTHLTYSHRLAHWTTLASSDQRPLYIATLDKYPHNDFTSDYTLAMALNHVFSISPNQLKKLQAITPALPPVKSPLPKPASTPTTPKLSVASTPITPRTSPPHRLAPRSHTPSTPITPTPKPIPIPVPGDVVSCTQCGYTYTFFRHGEVWVRDYPYRKTPTTVYFCSRHQPCKH